jgi:hypothetical protein
MTSPLRRKHRTTVLNTRGLKTADRGRPLQAIRLVACRTTRRPARRGWAALSRLPNVRASGSALLGCAVLAAWLASGASLRASDEFDSPQPAAPATAPSTDSVHATRLKWRPYRPSVSQSTDGAQSDADQPVFSDAAPQARPKRPVRVIHDGAIVPAQAIQSTDPNKSPFDDDKVQPGARPMPLPAPPTTDPDATNPNIGPGGLAPSTSGPNLADPDTNPLTPRSRLTRPRSPARLNQDAPFDAPTGPARGSAPAVTPFISPSPSDMEDLSCNTHQHHCKEDVAALMQNTVSKIGLDISVEGKQGDTLPCDCSVGDGVVFESRQWPLITYTWKASALCHKPLYFEEVQLERYGHSPGPIVEPLLSAAHFFITVPLLPYYMGVDPPQECQYTLGYYRPGDCAPYMLDPFPLSVRGAVLEAGAIVGVSAVIP